MYCNQEKCTIINVINKPCQKLKNAYHSFVVLCILERQQHFILTVMTYCIIGQMCYIQ